MSLMFLNLFKNRQKGIGLLELAMALLILGLLLLMFQDVFKLFYDVDHRLEQLDKNRILKGSVETYLAVNSRLPCPDTDGNGQEDFASGSTQVCDSTSGGLPFDDLGVEQNDAWGNPYYYQVVSSADDSSAQHACSEASIFAKSGSIITGASENFYLCEDTNEFACSRDGTGNDLGVSGACTPTGWLQNASLELTEPPYFSLFTPATSELTVNDESGSKYSEDVLAVIISWGANGDEVNISNCPSSLPAGEEQNCNSTSDGVFVNTTTGLNSDYLVIISLSQAKRAVVQSRRFK